MAFLNRLSFKIASGLLLYLLGLSIASAVLMVQGFHQAQVNATARSNEGWETQGRIALMRLVEDEAQISDAALMRAENMTVTAADYMTAMIQQNGDISWDSATLSEADDGQYYDGSPNRITDVWIGNTMTVNDQTMQDLQDSAVLNALFPTLMDHNSDAIAIYYMNPQGVGRYYPVADLVNQLAPDFQTTAQPFFALASPEENPLHQTIWVPPYVDYVTSRPITSVSTPVYVENEFRGVISVDLSLTRLIERLNRLRSTRSGYSFLVDDRGRLVAAPPDAVSDFFGPVSSDFSTVETMGLPLESASNADLRNVVLAMREGDSGLTTFSLDGEPVLLAYAPLPTTGWSVATVAPLAEITAQAQAISQHIEDDASRTLRNTLVIMGVGFIFVFASAVGLGNIVITRPLQKLKAGTQAITAGDLNQRINITSQDELGVLAVAFNQMAAELSRYRDEMEQQVANRTRELSALFDVTAVASKSLDQTEVLEQSLAQVVDVMDARYASVYLLAKDDGMLHLAGEHYGLADAEAGPALISQVLPCARRVLAKAKPLCVPMTGWGDQGKSSSIQPPTQASFLGVPMITKDNVTGVLSVIGTTHKKFSPDDEALLASIADQIGVAVENARLYHHAEELAVFKERQRLARELHDAVTQSLYSLTLLAETGRRAAHQGDMQQSIEYLTRLKEVGHQALKEMRLLVYELHPLALAQESLVDALQHRLDAVEKRAGISVELEAEGHIAVNAEAEVGMYRIAQEALNNSLKHSEATQITVSLHQNDSRLVLVVRDNGAGFDASEENDVGGGMGLANMRNRAAQIGARLEIMSHPGSGTEIRVTLPDDGKDNTNG